VRMMSVVSLLASLLLVTCQAVTGQLIGSDDGTNQQSGNRCIDDEQNPQVPRCISSLSAFQQFVDEKLCFLLGDNHFLCVLG
jgi:hypothetical protein